MKQAFIMVVSLVLVATATVHAEVDTGESWKGFDLNQLETLSNNVFKQLDADENGSITLDEIDLLKEDSDEIPKEDALALRQQRLGLVNSYFWTEEEVNTFEVGDTNGDGSLNQDEFDNLESNVRTHVLELGLTSLDTDKNGSVEANEFSAHLDNFEEWDADGNGTIDREELAEISDRRFHTDIRRRWAARAQRQAERDRIALEMERRQRLEAEQERRDTAEDEND